MNETHLTRAGEPPVGDGAAIAAPMRRTLWTVGVTIVIWFGFWSLTPGLLSNGVGHFFTSDLATSIVVETALAAALAIPLVVLHRRFNRVLFARSWGIWLYALPVALAIALPFHYELVLPVVLYTVWMTVSVFWQDYLTFGLLQAHLGERLPTWGVVVTSAVIFWLGHVLFLPDRFGGGSIVPSLAILALGFALGSLRVWTRTLHLILALHLSFYFLFA